MSQSNATIEIVCDVCGEREEFCLPYIFGQGWYETDMKKSVIKAGWRLDLRNDIFPQCAKDMDQE